MAKVIEAINEDRLLGRLIEILELNGIRKVVLFGSRAKGNFRERSDFDLSVWGSKDSIIKSKYDIDSLVTLYKVDIVDYENCSNDLLKEEIDRYGRTLYG